MSNAFKNQHIKYVPKKRLSFDIGTPDGPMALIFQANDISSQAMNWKVALASALPAAAMAAYMVPPVYLPYAYPALFSPALYGIFDAYRTLPAFRGQVHKMYLLKNGAQMVIETFDRTLHKVSILHNHENAFEEAKDGSLIFVMVNNGRKFKLASKDAVLVDYDLTDRVVRAITVDTTRSQQVYHRLISRP